MTAQHAPHTPLWRRVRSLPHTRLGRWAIGLTVGSGILLIFGLLLFLSVGGFEVSPWIWMILIGGILAGAVVGLIALLRSPQLAPPIPLSRRVLYVWLAMMPLALVAAVPIAFAAQFLRYQVRNDLSIVTVLPLVGMMAGVVALHFVQRGTERYGLGGTIYSLASLIGGALIVVGALIGYVSQDWLLGTNLMGVGLWAAIIGLTALTIITLYARAVPWWGGAALIIAHPVGGAIISNLLFSFLPEAHNAHSPEGKIARALDLTGSAEQWLHVGWVVAWGVLPWVVVGFAALLAARRRTERPTRGS
ncbi:MAG TPA: hypothetical protein VFY59_06910 [Rubrobacter sp.]|nr:hypothetical protein [Rubrobacter sp.]